MRINRSYIGGEWREGAQTHEQADVYTAEPYSRTFLASVDDVDEAVAAARAAAGEVAAQTRLQRAKWLNVAAERLEQRAAGFVDMLVAECGKPLRGAQAEVDRAVETLRHSAVEALKRTGDLVPMDASPRGVGKFGFHIQVPIGVVVGITPFNAPLNLLCHKLGPALAAGNAIVIKPDPRAASVAVALYELLDSLDLPRGAVGLVQGGRDVGEALVRHDEVDLISFTGGRVAAQSIIRMAGLKRVLLELGGNAGNMVCADADLEDAARQLAENGFSHAGQSCIGVQRIYVEETVVDRFMPLFLERVRDLVVGDPRDALTDVGPLFDIASVERLQSWIEEAVGRGAVVLQGGKAHGKTLEPTVIGNVDTSMRVVCEEVFGPIVTVSAVPSVAAGIAAINDSRYGMQAGVFTRSLETSLACARDLHVGGVVVNGTSNYRVDHQPYGGVKDSGIGREGPAFAYDAMSEIRMVVLQGAG